MTKSFKKFREEWDDDEWGNDEDRDHRKKKQMEKRKARRKEKYEGRWDDLDDKGEKIKIK
jgi:hypothetical protein